MDVSYKETKRPLKFLTNQGSVPPDAPNRATPISQVRKALDVPNLEQNKGQRPHKVSGAVLKEPHLEDPGHRLPSEKHAHSFQRLAQQQRMTQGNRALFNPSAPEATTPTSSWEQKNHRLLKKKGSEFLEDMCY